MMSAQKEILLLGAIAVTAALIVGFPAFLRHFLYLVMLVALPALLVLMHTGSEQWTLFAPVIATALTGWILAIRMARYLPSRRRSKTPSGGRTPATAKAN